jgi:hypothetical protein
MRYLHVIIFVCLYKYVRLGKADASALEGKADIGEIARLSDLLAELSRRVAYENREVADAIALLKKNLEKRLEVSVEQISEVAGD